jgi:hypothetical protein
MTYLNTLIAVAVIQQLLDMWTTIKALETGRAREANKPLANLMDKVGVIPALSAMKAPMIAILVLLPEATWPWYVVLGLIVSGYTWLLYNNFTVLRRLGVL